MIWHPEYKSSVPHIIKDHCGNNKKLVQNIAKAHKCRLIIMNEIRFMREDYKL